LWGGEETTLPSLESSLCVRGVLDQHVINTDMGLTSVEREFLRVAFSRAFSFQLELGEGEPVPTVGIVDFMKYVKVIAEKDVASKADIVQYFVNRVRGLLLDVNSTLRDLVVMVDGKPPPVKRLVVHKKRYDNVDRLSSPGDRSKRYLSSMNAENWMRFAGNYHLLQRELYPELFNAFMSCTHWSPAPGQTLILSGFPGRTAAVEGTPGGRKVLLWQPGELPITKAMEREDPELYHRTYLVRCFEKGVIQLEEWEAARNNIAEADIRMFWFDHFYQRQHIMFYSGDGDIFSIGALYAFERRLGIHVPQVEGGVRKYEFRNRHTACLPYLKKPKAGEPDPGYREEYVNLDQLYAQMREYPPMVNGGVQNPVLSMVFLIILCGSDFCHKFLHEMGTQNLIWNVFLQNTSTFSHMVMLLEGMPGSTRTQRTVVIDEECFKLFVRYCHAAKHEPTRRKLKLKRLSYAQLKHRTQHMADGKTPQPDTRNHMPEPNVIRANCRAIEWNLRYWVNGPNGHVPNPFELWQGVPYFPYRRNAKGKGEISEVVSHKPKPVDRVYEQHFYKP